MMWESYKEPNPTLRGHFASVYLVGSNMLRAYLFFIYGLGPESPLLSPNAFLDTLSILLSQRASGICDKSGLD